MILIHFSIVYLKNKEVIVMQLILQISTHDFLELDELCESVKKATNEKITVTNYIELWIWVNTSDTICENFFEIPAGEYLIVSTSGQTKTVWPLIEAMKLKPCGNLAKKM